MKKKNGLNVFVFVISITVILLGCKKNDCIPIENCNAILNQVDFKDSLVTAYQRTHMFIDVDSNGRPDIIVTSFRLGIPGVDTTKIIFEIGIRTNFEILVDINDEVMPMENGDTIPKFNTGDKHWVNLDNSTILTKNQPEVNSPFWSGPWKNKTKKAFPFRYPSNNNYYYGWIILSSDEASDGIRVSKVSWHKEPNKNNICF